MPKRGEHPVTKTRWCMSLAAFLVIMMVAMVGCGPRDTDDPDPIVDPDEPRELILAQSAEIEGTDPQQASNISWWVGGMLGTAPISLGLNNDQILPWGAEAVEVSEDGLEIRLTFNPERKFHNGEPVTAEAVLASIERYLELSPYAFDYDPVESMSVDGDTLVFNLEESGPALMVVLGSSYAVPVEVGAAAEMGEEEFHRRTVGCGPFKVDEWVDGSHITMIRNDDYLDYLPFVDNNGPFNFSKLTVRFIPEAFTRVSELRAGNVHMISGIPSEMLGTLRDDPNIELHDYISPNTKYLQMNTDVFPFTEKEARMAIAYALNREEIASALDGAIEPLYSLVGHAMISHDPATESRIKSSYGHNVARAKEILEEAGWSPGSDGIMAKDGNRLSFEFAISGDSEADKKAGPIIQAQLAQAGIDVSIREYETRYIRQMVRDKEFEMTLSNWNWLDPGGVWPATLAEGGAFNVWSHPEVDSLLDAAIVVPDPGERAKAWGALTERVWEDVPLIPVWSDRIYFAGRTDLEGFTMSVSGVTIFHDMFLKD